MDDNSMDLPIRVASLPFVADVLSRYVVTLTPDNQYIHVNNPDDALNEFFIDNSARITDQLTSRRTIRSFAAEFINMRDSRLSDFLNDRQIKYRVDDHRGASAEFTEPEWAMAVKIMDSMDTRMTKPFPAEFINASDSRLRDFLNDRKIKYRVDRRGASAEFTEPEWDMAMEIMTSMEGDLDQELEYDQRQHDAEVERSKVRDANLRGKCLNEMAKYGINDISREAWAAIKHEVKLGRPMASACAGYAENERRVQAFAACETIFARNDVNLSPRDRKDIMARIDAGETVEDICTPMARAQADRGMIDRCERIFRSFKLDMRKDLTEQEARMIMEGLQRSRDAETVCTNVARIATERIHAEELADIDQQETSHQREEDVDRRAHQRAKVRNSLHRVAGKVYASKIKDDLADTQKRCIGELMALRSKGYPVSDDTLKAINDAQHPSVASMICHRAKNRAVEAGMVPLAKEDGWDHVESLAAVSAQIASQAAHNLTTDLAQGISVVPKLQVALSDPRLLPNGKLELIIHATAETQKATDLEAIANMALAMERDIPGAPIAVARGLMRNTQHTPNSAVTPQVAQALITHMRANTTNDRTRHELGGFLSMLAELIGILLKKAGQAIGRGYGWVKSFWSDVSAGGMG